MTIVLDAMGSDQNPDPEIKGAILAAEAFKQEIILTGDENQINEKLHQWNTNNLPISVVHAPDAIDMNDKAVASGRSKPQNSMAVGMQLVKDGKADAFVTAGNTGAAMFNGIKIFGRLKGIQRPALSTLIPTRKGHSVLIDLGVNADCRPGFLQQFAIMGSVYAETVLGIDTPSIGLLSNGEEPGKGNALVKETYPLLEKTNINFHGNVEGKELFGGIVDVVVTDGFTGNVLLKTSEAVAKLITDVLKEEMMQSTRTKLGGLLAKPVFNKIKQMLDPREVGAAPLLGLGGLAFVGHGRSDEIAIMNSIKIAVKAVHMNLLANIEKAIEERLYS